ncbi:MAG: CDP-diacylglycerol--glycerol-3-phosphate 3-phosphatidyltransferase [Clostridia bacterium]|nr:CDP-diacylglycerol--glycerol-3-phosphate 3-phosphatidyltransferase [Clostridia bacterium]
MNLPNKLTLTRVLLIPVMLLFLALPGQGWCWAACAVFCAAAWTDYLDGHIARRDNLITDFGRFLDPVADKLLVLTAMVMLTGRGLLPALVPAVVLSREIAVDGLRMVAAQKGIVISAGKLGKIKTVSQMALLILLMLIQVPAFSFWLTGIIAIWVLVITLWSGAEYLINNAHVLKQSGDS